MTVRTLGGFACVVLAVVMALFGLHVAFTAGFVHALGDWLPAAAIGTFGVIVAARDLERPTPPPLQDRICQECGHPNASNALICMNCRKPLL